MRRAALTLCRALATLVGVWFFLQMLPRILPEDPARIALGEWATETDVASLRHQLRLDLPFMHATASSFWDLLHGSLGESLRFHRPVARVIAQAFPVSLVLALLSILLSLLLALSLAGPSRRAAWARAAAVASPVYVGGPLLLWAVAQHVAWIPVAGIQSPASWILPCLALAIPLSGHQARIIAQRLAELRGSLGLRVWEGAGIPAFTVLRKWLLPGIAGPWLTVLGLQLGGLLGGAVLTESIFGIPGLGQQLTSALAARDVPLMQGIILLGAALYAGTQVAVEWLQEILEPGTS